MSTDELRSNIDTIRENMYEAANSVGRDSAEIQLHAATKGVDPIRILDSINCGLTDFGANWVQGATPKIESVANSLENAISRPTWHMIGHLQKNKIKFLRANVGDRYVKEKMQKNNFNLGGEQSGPVSYTHLTLPTSDLV